MILVVGFVGVRNFGRERWSREGVKGKDIIIVMVSICYCCCKRV